jgi:hypothetical protein
MHSLTHRPTPHGPMDPGGGHHRSQSDGWHGMHGGMQPAAARGQQPSGRSEATN